MIKILLAASTLALVGLPAAALAQEGSRTYATLGYSQVETEQVTLGAVTGRVGWKALPHLAVEGEASVGVKDDTFKVPIGISGGKIKLKHDAAAYAVGFMPLGEHVELFVRAGYGTSKIESTVSSVIVRGEGESFNYGVGASVFHGFNGLRADWTRRDFTKGGAEADTWSVSYVRRF